MTRGLVQEGIWNHALGRNTEPGLTEELIHMLWNDDKHKTLALSEKEVEETLRSRWVREAFISISEFASWGIYFSNWDKIKRYRLLQSDPSTYKVHGFEVTTKTTLPDLFEDFSCQALVLMRNALLALKLVGKERP